jgi:hypothetical protein
MGLKDVKQPFIHDVLYATGGSPFLPDSQGFWTASNFVVVVEIVICGVAALVANPILSRN